MLELREVIERLQAELRFEKTRNAALNFEVARLKRWRFGSSSESLDETTQTVLFDAILADTLLENVAAQQARKPEPTAPPAKRQATRQALPANLPRIDHHHELEQTHCACGGSTTALKTNRQRAAYLARGKTPGAGQGESDRQGNWHAPAASTATVAPVTVAAAQFA